jgi:EmrB/QacA subfamily drug resistance transporter
MLGRPPKPLALLEADGESAAVGRWLILGAVAVGAYMSALDTSIVNAILPILTQDFNIDVAIIEWVVITYLLVQTGLTLSFGRLGDLRGHRLVYTWGFAVFVFSSALCGLAPSAWFLVAARALQAVGAAMINANSVAILSHSFPIAQRGRILGWQATAVYLGVATGPLIGGWLATYVHWRAVFYVNVPIGLLALFLSLRYIPADQPSGRRERFDLAGAAVYMLGLVGVLLALNQGYVWGWTSLPVLGSLILGVVLLFGFVQLEQRLRSPMLDLGLFRHRAFSAPVLSAVLNYVGVSSTFFLMPFYLIQGRGLSAAQAGLLLTIQPIVMAVTASRSGALSDRIGTRRPATLGMLVLAGGLFLLSRVDDTTSFVYVGLALAVVGLGIGLFTSPNNSAVMSAAPDGQRGVAAGILSTARTLGNTLGIGMAGAIFSTVVALSTPGDPQAIDRAVGGGLLAASVVALLGMVSAATRPSTPRQAALNGVR